MIAQQLPVGAIYQLRPAFYDQNKHMMQVAPASISYSSDTPAVATVDPVKGIVTAVGAGSVNITATSGSLSASHAFTVYVPVASSLVI